LARPLQNIDPLAQHLIPSFKRRPRPTSTHQISLQTSLIADSINRIALARY